ncbi:DUF2306 domain-containing protein [Janthinobacterium lividum]|uniref:DUF2306 domain-containing protein n=1 Tax=Janthinobacterium lividum TaxID=29581 RepID=A0ABU0XMG9_9BURK|nr:DUF2306 domain-containing protein [Janthinobacterium lividum]MDQ4624687.1 DUF2306 domain-containing protein [Janthinobacterium lividum]MDQ4673709.1 DUF2306 domain-containing protein [Janthinobacterium lividum]MDQ4684439.1 DUF2306 domain-containing protein [Janthinobacterium lividum]
MPSASSTTSPLPSPRLASSHRWAATALSASARFWFLATVTGQLFFAAYIIALYGGAAARGDLPGWNAVMTHGHVPGDGVGNVATGVHLLLAAILMLGGALQLVPHVRRHAPRLHRWNGRVYLAGAVLAALSGLYMLWWRGAVGDTLQHLGTSLNAVLVLLFAGLALQNAVRREFAAHRRWALRLFLAVSGVWFFRVGLMCWLAVNGGPAGFDPASFTGPFLSFLAFAQYLLPLAVLEAYLRCRDGGNAMLRLGMAAVLALLTVAMSAGIAVAAIGMWLPRMHG